MLSGLVALAGCRGSGGVDPGVSLHLSFVSGPAASVAATDGLGAVTVIFADPDGNIVASSPRTVQLSLVSTDTAAHVVGATTVLSAAGVANFAGLSVPRVGTGYRLVAKALSVDSAITPVFAVVPGPVAELQFSGTSNVVAGDTLPTLTVQVTDALGNVITNASPSVTLSIASGGGALIGTTTTSAVGGVATFPGLSLHIAGTHILRATAGGVAGNSNAFFVSSGALSQWLFSAQPVSTSAGAVLQAVTVSCTDSYGNLATVGGPYLQTTVTLSIGANPGGAVLGGTLTKAGQGTVQFSDLTLDKSGSGYTLVVTPNSGYCGSMPGATSTAFNITP